MTDRSPAPARKPSAEDTYRADNIERSRKKLLELQKGRLPQMVDWIDPPMLGASVARLVISTTIGDYADQRPMQAAMDEVGEAELASRHDYRQVFANGLGASIESFPDGRYSASSSVFQAADGKWFDPESAPGRSLNFEPDGSLWVDFIADLGDGFEATYAMAYLLAQPSLTPQVRAALPADCRDWANKPLPAGDILIMGGDMAYPTPTITEYNTRCLEPYDAAFQPRADAVPQRQPRNLLFIAGNHDWYDGLGAFTSVFCAARDRFAHGKGKKIGGWQCEQRRSYFALGLPHGWWFWGVDLALNETVDDAQKNYFEMMSERTAPGDKIIIILHAPVWQTTEHSPLHDISQLARRQGADVVALLAGDLHFYCRYHGAIKDSQNKDMTLQLITSGGGGAFLHPTHMLPRTTPVHWSVPDHPAHPPQVHPEEFKDTVVTATIGEDADSDSSSKPIVRTFLKPDGHLFQTPSVYPSRGASWWLAFKNLALPFRNRSFAWLVGLVYLIFAWVFQIAAYPVDARKRVEGVGIDQACAFIHPAKQAPYQKCRDDELAKLQAGRTTTTGAVTSPPDWSTPALPPTPALPLADAKPTQDSRSPLAPKKSADRPKMSASEFAAAQTRIKEIQKSVTSFPGKQIVSFAAAQIEKNAKEPDKAGVEMSLAIAEWFEEVRSSGGWAGLLTNVIYPSIAPEQVLHAMLANPAFFFMVIGLYFGLVMFVGMQDAAFKSVWLNFKQRWLMWPIRLVLGIPHAWAHLTLMLVTDFFFHWILTSFTQVGHPSWVTMATGITIYSVLMILVGGLFGGFLFGLYWTTASLLGVHQLQAFGALKITGYKNFLRMRVDKDTLTIFPIGLDKTPGRKGWRQLKSDDDMTGHNPLLHPIEPLSPHLIEAPIVMKAPRAAALA